MSQLLKRVGVKAIAAAVALLMSAWQLLFYVSTYVKICACIVWLYPSLGTLCSRLVVVSRRHMGLLRSYVFLGQRHRRPPHGQTHRLADGLRGDTHTTSILGGGGVHVE